MMLGNIVLNDQQQLVVLQVDHVPAENFVGFHVNQVIRDSQIISAM